MSGEPETIAAGPTDDELFDAAMSDEPPAQSEAPEPPPAEDGGQPRDEQGRFASTEKSEPDKTTEPADGEERDGGMVPSWRLREESAALRAERQEREAERQELQRFRQFHAQQQWQQRQVEQPPQRPDPISDPDGFADYMEWRQDQKDQIRAHEIRNDRINLTFENLRESMEEKGQGEVFDKAYEALLRAPTEIKDEITATVNPAKAMLRWHKRSTVLTDMGDDPEGFINRKLDERLKDPEVRKRMLADMEAEARGGTGNNRSTVIHIPSVNRATGGGNNSRSNTLPVTDGDFFNDAVAGLRR